MSHHTKDKGDLAVAKTIAHLLQHNIRVCLPLSEHLPFDLIAVMPDMRTLSRVQVKYRKNEGLGTIRLNFSSNYYDSKRIYSRPVNLDHIDCYAAYCPDTDEIYYVRVDEIGTDKTKISLRVAPVKNGQKKGIWMAENFVDPNRIVTDYGNQSAPTHSHYANHEFELAIAYVTADLMVKGWQVCVPNSAYIPFDLIAIAPDMKTLSRICVGDETSQLNSYADQYAIYEPKTKAIHYLDANELNVQDRELKNQRTIV